MISLNKTVTKKFAYVKNDVIFGIKATDNGDACVVSIDDETVPYITVGEDKQYFDSYIEVGDIYTSGDGFKKTVHSTNGEPDEEMTFPDYYRMICEEEIAKTIINYYTYNYDDFASKLSRLNIPVWMLEQDPAKTKVDGVEKINFTEEYYNESKEKSIKKLALESASKTTNRYGYKLTKPAKVEDLEIEKLEE